MFETFGFEDTSAKEASVLFALALGLLFGASAQLTRFCFRRALIGEDRRQAAGIWAMALAVAVAGTQAAVAQGWISFETHRLLSSDLPVLAIGLGGLMFGTGMVLTRGCVSRLMVLSGSGNLRAAMVVIVFAIVAHATLKGVLAPLRVALGSVTLDLGEMVSLAALPGGALFWSTVLVAGSLTLVRRSGNSMLPLVGAALIGLLVPLGWVGTGYVLFDDFDPIAMESLSFTAATAETLFYGIAASAIPAGFGTGLVMGVLAGATLAALLTGGFHWQSFSSPGQTGRYMTGAVLMGLGGVLAGGCTVGAGLAGVPTLGIAALLALASIALGGIAANWLLSAFSSEFVAPPARQAQQQEV
ncbi:MAG: YeeE/YedE family protein [Rhodobacteraceae bacterium]|nr:MAG: YeeE/YedE family protein [Paracoccaceae bacterium]